MCRAHSVDRNSVPRLRAVYLFPLRRFANRAEVRGPSGDALHQLTIHFLSPSVPLLGAARAAEVSLTLLADVVTESLTQHRTPKTVSRIAGGQVDNIDRCMRNVSFSARLANKAPSFSRTAHTHKSAGRNAQAQYPPKPQTVPNAEDVCATCSVIAAARALQMQTTLEKTHTHTQEKHRHTQQQL